MLKFSVQEITEVPAELQSYYDKTEDGSYRLKVEGVVLESDVAQLKAKNKELRESNIGLLKTNESLSSFEQVFGIGNVKPDVIQSKIQEIASKKAESLVTEMKANYETKMRELETGLIKKSSKLTELMLGEAVQKAGVRHGVVATAFDDVLRRAQSDFEVTDEGLKFKHEKLDAEGKAYNLDSWMAEQAKQAPHLFASSQGTGATRPAKANQAKAPPVSRLAAGLQQRATGNKPPRI